MVAFKLTGFTNGSCALDHVGINLGCARKKIKNLVRDRSRHVHSINPADTVITVDIGGADRAPGGFRTAGAGKLDLVTADASGQAGIVSLPRSHVSDT